MTDFEKYAAIYDTTRTYDEILFSTDDSSTPLAEIASLLAMPIPAPRDGYRSNGVHLHTGNYEDESGFDIVASYIETDETRKERLQDGYEEFLKRDRELQQAIKKRQSMDEEKIEKQDLETLRILARKYSMKVERIR